MNACEWCNGPTRRRAPRWVPWASERGTREIRRRLVCDTCFNHNRFDGTLPGQAFTPEDDPPWVVARLARGTYRQMTLLEGGMR